jgi:hypothetical protein
VIRGNVIRGNLTRGYVTRGNKTRGNGPRENGPRENENAGNRTIPIKSTVDSFGYELSERRPGASKCGAENEVAFFEGKSV